MKKNDRICTEDICYGLDSEGHVASCYPPQSEAELLGRAHGLLCSILSGAEVVPERLAEWLENVELLYPALAACRPVREQPDAREQLADAILRAPDLYPNFAAMIREERRLYETERRALTGQTLTPEDLAAAQLAGDAWEAETEALWERNKLYRARAPCQA